MGSNLVENYTNIKRDKCYRTIPKHGNILEILSGEAVSSPGLLHLISVFAILKSMRLNTPEKKLLLGALVVLVLLSIFKPNFNLGDITFFYINGRAITLMTVVTLAVMSWLIKILPSPFREIISFFLILWILSVLGLLFPFAGLSNLLIFIILVVVLFSIF